jgi:hypothetical protein
VNPGEQERKQNKSAIALNMLQSYSIPGLVPMKREQTDLRELFYYDLTSRRVLAPLVRGNGLAYEDFCKIVCSIVSTIADSSVYMLDEQRYLLHEQFIFIGESMSDVQLTYLPIDDLPELPDTQSQLLALMNAYADSANHRWNEAAIRFHARLKQEGAGFQAIKQAADDWLFAKAAPEEMAVSYRPKPPVKPLPRPVFAAPAVELPPTPLPPALPSSPPRKRANNPLTGLFAFVLACVTLPLWLQFARHPGEGQFYLNVGTTLLLLDAAYWVAIRRKPMARPPSVPILDDELFDIPDQNREDYSFTGPPDVSTERLQTSDEPLSHPTTLLTSLAPTVLLSNAANPYTTINHAIRLEVKHNGESEVVTLPSSGGWTVGRDSAIAHYTIDSAEVSRVHAEWICEDGQVQVRDLGSRNGTYLNGELLVPFKLQPFGADDVLAIVQTEFRLHSKNSR